MITTAVISFREFLEVFLIVGVFLGISRKLNLKKEFEINTVAIQTASINLVANEDGTKNFEFKKKDSTATAKAGAGLAFNIQKISIDHTQFDFRNKARGQHIALNLRDEVIKMDRHSGGFDFKLKGEVEIGGLLFKPEKGAFLSNTSANHSAFRQWPRGYSGHHWPESPI